MRTLRKLTLQKLSMVLAPLILLTFVVWERQWQEVFWPAHPRILDCYLRAPTPLELALGAQVGLTTRAIVPSKPDPCPGLRVSLAGDQHRKEVWYSPHRTYRSRFGRSYYFLEEHHAFKWSHTAPLEPSEKPLAAIVMFKTGCGRAASTMQKQFDLTTEGLTYPNPSEARRANFRVKKVALQHTETKGILDKQPLIIIDIEDVSDESEGVLSSPECLNWSWYDTNEHRIHAAVAEWKGNGLSISQVTTRINLAGIRIRRLKGAKIEGLLSINNGWPQNITIQWPEQLSQNSTFTDMNFITELAPLLS